MTQTFIKDDILNSLLDNLDEALIILDDREEVLLYNEAAVKLNQILFLKPLQKGKILSDSINPGLRLVIRDVIQEVQVKNETQKHFLELKGKQDSTVFLEFNFVPVIDQDNALSGINILIRDATPQKVFEKKLIIQASNITSLIEKANAIIIGLDTRGYIIEWNEHCEKITGFTKDDVYAHKFSQILMKDIDGDRFEKILADALNHNSTGNQELVIRAKNGNLVTFFFSCTPRISTTSQVVGLTLVGHDITELTEYRMTLEMKVEERTRELRRALQKEQEVVEMKNRFVSIASHEFRSPLTSILSQIKNINRSKKLNDLEKRFNLIEEQTRHMLGLLDDVLAYGEKNSFKMQPEFTQVEVSDFLNKIVDEVGLAGKKKHTIRTELSLIPKVITSDEKLLRSILINLLTNAIKYSPGKDFVYLTVRGSGNNLIIIVKDEGIGIPDDEIDKIYEPFHRGKSVASIQGTGLGLSILKKSVEVLNGTIHTKSKVGLGSTFTVTIPLEQDISDLNGKK